MVSVANWHAWGLKFDSKQKVRFFRFINLFCKSLFRLLKPVTSFSNLFCSSPVQVAETSSKVLGLRMEPKHFTFMFWCTS